MHGEELFFASTPNTSSTFRFGKKSKVDNSNVDRLANAAFGG